MTAEPRNLARMATLFHALSDETRLGIVQRLRDGECCVCELTDALDAAQSRLSFHLKVLREAGIVDYRREGRWAYYWLLPDAFAAVDNALKSLKPSRAGLALAASQRGLCCG